jgi:Zn-dependent M28 family amino/carboxypeptidase
MHKTKLTHQPTIIKQLLTALKRIVITLTFILLIAWAYLSQPTLATSEPISSTIDQQRLQDIVKKLSIDFYPRNYRNSQNLEDTANYIRRHFEASGGTVTIQSFEVSNKTYKNVRCHFGNSHSPKVIVGAHYDSHGSTPGADDNASGVAGLIELAYLLGENTPNGNFELVAYSLEEPPYFATQYMGSHFHAKSTHDEGHKIAGVIVLEMIGYFTDTFGSQDYPSLLFKLIYPNRGNFIAVVGKMDQRAFTKQVKVTMKSANDLTVESINAPENIPGIDFSDHRNYWKFGYDAVMITDTAFYRNTAYHKASDTWDRLDYAKMGQVIQCVYSAIVQLNVPHTK